MPEPAGPQSATRTYLELSRPDQLRPTRISDAQVRVERVDDCPPSFWRYLYTEVGRAYHWVDRLPWTDDEVRVYLRDPRIQLWLLAVRGAPAGYAELRREDGGAVEIAYFGLLPDFTGRGLGACFLTEIVERAWAFAASRVWLHTSTLDHPSALPNYLSRGFTIVRREHYTI